MTTLTHSEARDAYRYLCESYCIDEPQPEAVVVPRLTAIELTVESSVHWVALLGPLGVDQEVIDAALYAPQQTDQAPTVVAASDGGPGSNLLSGPGAAKTTAQPVAQIRALTKSAARSQAHRESHMYRQGPGYIVSTWDDFYGCRMTSECLSFQVARHTLAEWRRTRTLQLHGKA